MATETGFTQPGQSAHSGRFSSEQRVRATGAGFRLDRGGTSRTSLKAEIVGIMKLSLLFGRHGFKVTKRHQLV
jgi:hypothetical protein